MKINRPIEAVGKVYTRVVGEDSWSVLEAVAYYLKSYDDEPDGDYWGDQYEITVTVRKTT